MTFNHIFRFQFNDKEITGRPQITQKKIKRSPRRREGTKNHEEY